MFLCGKKIRCVCPAETGILTDELAAGDLLRIFLYWVLQRFESVNRF
jgi:hypothetical protein